ncbi:hypothetical protein [Bradyrhizobium sp. JR3.5]
MLLEPEPHMLDIPAVSSVPDVVDIPELCVISDVVDSDDVAVFPAAPPVTGVDPAIAMPPPS